MQLQLNNNRFVPLAFALSPATCVPLAQEVGCLVEDLSVRVVEDYTSKKNAGKVCREIESSVTMPVGDREYRATVEMEVHGHMEAEEFRDVVESLAEAVGAIEREKVEMGLKGGMGSLGTQVAVDGVGLNARWTFYEVVDGVAERCS